jgi:molecular chaperone DnaK
MSAPNIPELYFQHLLPLIGQGLDKLAGAPKATVADEKTYRQVAAEPIWNSLPLPVRLIGRGKLRFDEFLLAARAEAFQVSADGKLIVRPDCASRLIALAQRMLPQPLGAPATLVAPPSPMAATPSAMAPVVPPALTPRVPSGPVIGIDLGTTYSVVASVDAHGRPYSIPNAVGDIITPSVVLLDESGPVVGKEAVQASAMEPEKIAECAKRDMGGKFYRKKVNGEFMPPEVISSMILRALKDDAERKLGKLQDAVITVPAYFDEARRQATIDAGKLAGLNVLDIINEPTAAAIAYGHQLGFLDSAGRATAKKPLRVLVYDLGGGTFDVTIVEIRGNSFQALATDGDNALGGKDWDEKIVQFAAQLFMADHREDPRQHPISNQELWLSAEIAKKTLTERPKATLYVNHLGSRMKAEISRAQFEDATAALLGRTRTTTEIVVRQAGLSWPAIDKVLLVGGSTRMPQVPRMLEELTGRPPERSVAVDEAVAHGAALYANLLRQKSDPTAGAPQFSVTNINSHSLGIIGVDTATGRRRNQILIPKNTPLPHTVSRTFKIQKAGKGRIVIRVVEGESERPEACIQVGACTIETPPDFPAGTPVQVSYCYQPDGRLEVKAQIVGQKKAATAVLQRDNSLSSDEMDLWSRCFFR